LQHRQHRGAAALQVCNAHQHVRVAAQRAHVGVVAAAALGPAGTAGEQDICKQRKCETLLALYQMQSTCDVARTATALGPARTAGSQGNASRWADR
jgi:hypothetical protein